MEEEDIPLLGASRSHDLGEKSQSSPKKEELADLKSMVLFHGKELAGKSFIRNPHYNLVRLGICENGVYKVDSTSPKLLAFWKFKEIKDSSYSGFSFTLQFRGGKSDYSMRTDDGEAICSYMEDFQKNAAKALERALSNPPMSKIPESGLMTLRRKFSAENKSKNQSIEPKFHTLNRKTKNASASVDPYTRLVHNIEVDSRLRYNSSNKSTPSQVRDNEGRRSYSFEVRPESLTKKPHEVQYFSTSDVRGNPSPPRLNGSDLGIGPHDKSMARELLSQRIKMETDKERKMTNGINSSPVSTKGEATTTLSTVTSSASPLSSDKRSSSHSPLFNRRKKLLPDHVTPFDKAGSAPPSLPPEKLEGEWLAMAGSSITKAQGVKKLDAVGKQKTTPTLLGMGHKNKKDYLPSESSSNSTSEEHMPLMRGTSSDSSSNNLYSPTDDFSFHSSSFESKKSGSNSSGTNSLTRSSNGSQLYDRLEDFLPPSRKGGAKGAESWETFSNSDSSICSPAPPTTSTNEDESSLRSESSLRMSNSSSVESGVYDHLPPTSPPPPSGSGGGDTGGSKYLVGDLPTVTLGDPGIRRNISQPALSTPTSARESPCDQFGQFGSIDEESSDEQEEETGATPTNSDEESEKSSALKSEYEGVVLRQRKRVQDDPFADLMSPKSSSRLRWSQELNPLYDYIKGFKAEGVRLYDSSPVSKLLKSTTASSLDRNSGGERRGSNGKPPSIIIEDEGEDCSSIMEDDLESVTSHDTVQSPTSPMPIFGEVSSLYGDALTRSRRQHNYEEITTMKIPPSSLPTTPRSPVSIMDQFKRSESSSSKPDHLVQKNKLKAHGATVHHKLDTPRDDKIGVSPRLGKRAIIQQRRSRTLVVRDDAETGKTKQRPVRAAEALKDFPFVMREFRLFFVKMPNGFFLREIFTINKPISELREKLCEHLGVDNPENFKLTVEGSCLSTLRESETGVDVVRVNRAGLNYLVDSQILPDQGTESILLKTNLSFRMQGISTSRILKLSVIDPPEGMNTSYLTEPPPEDDDEFHKCWISVVQGNLPLMQEDAVKLAALQYQAYFLDRTAVNSVVGFSRPTEFLPIEFTGVRGVEQKMYKEQETLVKKTHQEIEDAYIDHCSQLESYGAVFFPAREPRKKLLQSTKLKPVIFGVGPRGILRVDPKTKELLGFWQYNVLKNWAYSKRTFVLAFRDKSFPVESNQAMWISSLVDFFVDSIVIIATANKSKENKE